MPQTNDLLKSFVGSFGTVILGKITVLTASQIAGFLTVLVGTLTAIHTSLKIYEWIYRWNHRDKPDTKPPEYEKENH